MERYWEGYSLSSRRDERGAEQMPTKLIACLTDCFHAELGAIAAYTYRSLITEGISRELSDTLDRIAVDETEHFRLVGALILSMGADPVVCTRVRSASVCLDVREEKALACRLTEMIDAAVGEEYEAVDRYRKAMNATDDRFLRSFLSQLIADEERHVRMLVTML